MTELMTRLRTMTEAEEAEALMRELNRLLDRGVIDSNLFLKARKMWGI